MGSKQNQIIFLTLEMSVFITSNDNGIYLLIMKVF